MVSTILLAILACLSTALATLNCQKDNVKFEKILGLRPAGFFQPILLHQAEDGRTPVTLTCLTKCLQDDECRSFVLFYANSSCYWYRIESQRFFREQEETLADSEVAWFRKTCFHEPRNCDKIWNFERIPGATLLGNDTKRVPEVVTRSECQQRCLNETAFECRSAKFRVRQLSPPYHQPHEDPNSETVGHCTLSNSDRHLSPSAYRVSTYDEEYLENQCTRNVSNVFCAFEEFPDVTMGHVDELLGNVTAERCREECDGRRAFNCRGYSLVPGSGVAQNQQQLFGCLIHGENSKVHGPKVLRVHAGAKYYERAPCLNVTVSCSHREMVVRFQPGHAFNGRLYLKGYSDNPECYALGNGTNLITLRLPLIVHRCGILEARSPPNRTLMSSSMIIQYNSLVQTQADRLINVGCIFSNSTKVVVGAGFNIDKDHTGLGTSIVNSSVALPSVDMRIVDLTTNGEVTDTEIGDDLKLVIEMRPRNNGFDIWAGHLIAMTENGRESILLLDDRGCPTNLDVFPDLEKTYDDNGIYLSSTFQAFKFSSSNVIRFSVIVQFCSGKCPSIDCGAIYNKNKRAVVSDGSTVVELTGDESFLEEMPLEFVLVVRNANTRPDRLVYGENNRILVAGYDQSTNEVCLDFSLLVGIAITWILIQIILLVTCIALIRKYKKHYEDRQLSESIEELNKNFGLGFSNLENARRVRFADGHLT